MNGQVNANLDTLPTVAESVTVTFTSGKAFVRAVPVWLDVAKGKGTYFITSTGTDNLSKIATGSGTTGTASRTVGVYVQWSRTTMNVMGALVSFSGIVKNGTGDISGIDACGADTNVAGHQRAGQRVGGREGKLVHPDGQSAVRHAQDVHPGLRGHASSTGRASVTGTSLPARHRRHDVLASRTFPRPATFSVDTNYWPIIHVHNRSDVARAGTGTSRCRGRGAACSSSTAT